MKIVCDKNYYTSKLKDHYKKIIPFDAKLYKNISNNKISLKIGYFDTLDICPSTERNLMTTQPADELSKSLSIV